MYLGIPAIEILPMCLLMMVEAREERTKSANRSWNTTSGVARFASAAGTRLSKQNSEDANLERWKHLRIVLPEDRCHGLIRTIMPAGDQTDIFTERTYQVADGGKFRVVFPVPVPRNGGWCCYLHIDGRTVESAGCLVSDVTSWLLCWRQPLWPVSASRTSKSGSRGT